MPYKGMTVMGRAIGSMSDEDLRTVAKSLHCSDDPFPIATAKRQELILSIINTYHEIEVVNRKNLNWAEEAQKKEQGAN